MPRSYVQELLDELLEAGVIRHNACYRDGQPVYVIVPDAELTETAKEMLNAIAKHKPS
jgi:predicted transcriptional regulator